MKKNYLLFFVICCLFVATSHLNAQTCSATPSAPAVSGITVAPCVPSSNFTLTAQASYSVGWYTNSWGGNAISNNSVYTTPVFSSGTGTTYYVGQTNSLSTGSLSLPSFDYAYNGTRGMWFTAPVSFIITGLRVPLDVGGTSNSAITVLKFPSAPPAFPTLTNAFNTLYLNQNIVGTGIVPVYIPVYAGDVIGIMGVRGGNTSYGTPVGAYVGTLGTNPITLTRMGMQYFLATQTPTDIWQEPSGAVGRMEVYTTIGCLSTLTPVTVTVTPAPPINITGPAGHICANTTTTLTASGVSTYTWFSSANGSSISVTPSVTTTYTVSGSISPTCSSSAAITITVDAGIPTLTVVQSGNGGGICPNSTVALTASGALTYTWTGGSVPVTNGVPFAPPLPADYTVTGLNSCGSTTASASVSVHPLPLVGGAPSSPSICSGVSLTLTATGNATNYVWSGHSSAISNGVGFSPVLTATYTVIGTSALSCTASAAVPVTVVTTPVIPPVASPALICIGGSSTLTAQGATNYTWTNGSQTVFTSSMVATPSTTGISTYTVTKANSNCVDTKIISVVTNSLPTIFAIVTPTLVCALNPATLAVGGGQSYTWTSSTSNVPFGGPSPIVYPPSPTTYSVAASDGTCINMTSVFLAVDPNPTILTTAVTSSAICKGQSVTVNANGGINYTVTSSAGGNFNTASVTESPTATIAYTFIGDNSFGCTSSAMQVVVVNPIPTISIVASKTLVCSGGPATLTANGALNYTWTSNNALTNTTVVNPTNTSSGPVMFTVAGSYSTGCQSTKTATINVFVPVLTVSGSTTACTGGILSLSGGGGNPGTYLWNTGTGTSNFQTLTTTLSAAAVFTLTASSTSITSVCPATKTVAVGVFADPVITAVAQRTTICQKESVDLYGQGGVSYVWNTSANTATITVSPTQQTNYTVTGTDANGCVSTGTIQVKVSNCVGINELSNSNNGLVVYPNPNNGEFNIQTNSDIKLSLVNELGQVIRTFNLSGTNNYKVSVTDLSKGIYFITGQKDNVQVYEKIVVTK